MSDPSGTDARLDRIEALTAKVKLMDDLDAINGEKIEALTAELNTCRMAQVVMDNTVAELEAKLAKVVAAAGKMLDAFCVHEDSHQSAAYEAMCAALAETERESHD